ncbi:tripartite motif-containing protein 16-like [Polypterus senegalus]|uniref:tripartite motif-containing protein 16-like n=1 Tax=Polypterus senegalus TaxID=55291 RepID=UPI001965694B|nr:tripartite motif-containing protein 16-like [Polypterus senegalus]
MTAKEFQDRFKCSVCLDILKEPVSIPCGHNYCKRCIEDYWDTAEVSCCPQCRQAFFPRPVLQKNTLLAEIILKSMQEDPGVVASYAELDDVSCDVCTESKYRAVHSCLTCLASYCETHIQPHKESTALKEHKLEKPSRNLRQKLCSEHQAVVQLFCRTDQKCVCLLCVAVKHKNHDLVEMEMEKEEKQRQLVAVRRRMTQRILEKTEKVVEMKENVKHLKICADTEVWSCEETIEKLRSKITDVIRDHEQRGVNNAKDQIRRLEKEIEDLKRGEAQLAELSTVHDHIHFLQRFPALHTYSQGEDAPTIPVNRNLLPEALRMDLSNLKKRLKEIYGWMLMKTTHSGAEALNDEKINTNCRKDLLKYFWDLTLDPKTAHKNLCLSEGNKKVTQCTDSPERFDSWDQVLCREAMSGARCYWEVEWTGDWAAIGIAYKGIRRKGKTSESLLGCNNKSWRLYCSDTCYSARHNNKVTEIVSPNSHRIGVYLDYPAGSLTFYSISDTVSLLFRFEAKFTEPLYPGFYVTGSVTICQLDQTTP